MMEGGLEPLLPHSSLLAGRQAPLGFAPHALALDSFQSMFRLSPFSDYFAANCSFIQLRIVEISCSSNLSSMVKSCAMPSISR